MISAAFVFSLEKKKIKVFLQLDENYRVTYFYMLSSMTRFSYHGAIKLWSPRSVKKKAKGKAFPVTGRGGP
jgi:hypothetical protein